MADNRIFLLFVSGDYSPRPVNPLASANIPATDAVSGLPVDSRLPRSRSRLPDLDGISFTFPKTSTSEVVQNFYHMDDFMIVSENFKDALAGRFGHELEISPVRIQHADGSPPAQSYFAVRVKTVIDCIDPDQSTWKSSWTEKVSRKFTDGLSVSLLDQINRKQFANGGGAKYISYPRFGEALIGEVKLIVDKIPLHTVFFQPKYWPGHWIIESRFADQLAGACGGASAYYFWALSLRDVTASHQEHLFQLR